MTKQIDQDTCRTFTCPHDCCISSFSNMNYVDQEILGAPEFTSEKVEEKQKNQGKPRKAKKSQEKTSKNKKNKNKKQKQTKTKKQEKI